MKSSLVSFSKSAICNPQSAIIVLFIVMLAATWQRWTQPLVDHGREMNVPTRILAGERIYNDIQLLYGPFATYFNALLYQIFGIHLSVLKAAGAVSAILILLIIYKLARALMSEWESFLVAGLTLVLCALKSTANYVQPYAYAALYGLVFSLGSLSATVSYIKSRANSLLVLSGSLAGLSLISKPEIALAGLAAGLTALIIESLLKRKPLWLGAAAFSAPVAIIAAVTYSIVLSRTPLHVLLVDNHVLFTEAPPQLIYFNRYISGLARWPSSLWFSLAGIGAFALWVGVCAVIGALASRKQAEWRRALKAGLTIVCAGAIWTVVAIHFSRMSGNITPFAAAAFILPALIGLIISDWWKKAGGQGDKERTRQGEDDKNFPHPPITSARRILLVIVVFGFVAILRVMLNVAATGPYAPFYLPASIIVYLYLLFYAAPALLTKTDSIRVNIRRVATLMIMLMVIGIGVNSAIRLRRSDTFTVGSPRGSFITVPEIGGPLQAAIQYAQERTGPDDYLLAAPEATTINFLAARRYPLKEEIILPGFLTGQKELDAIERIKDRKTPLILVVNIDTSEFGDHAFGVDYNEGLMRWIVENYRLAARFDSAISHHAKLGDKPFFILAYERN
ncbi:MAG: glycosyltransferase family 39 protein [Chloracidobacterium sp.]|nr:glycosyltransferase family 39 protein [Chloracidobacterium sp.]